MNLLDLMVKIGVDDQASDEVSSIGGAIKRELGEAAGAAGKGLVTGLKAVGAAGVAAGTAVVGAAGAMGKAALDGYADYEQLSGGVDKLFNETQMTLEEYAASTGQTAEEASHAWAQMTAGARIVKNNAEAAFKTAGLTANEYMETVTGFSAALINDMGGNTVEAAKLADVAIRDMSDNANTFGTDMESIQNAYAGFSKGNFTMLDNLKLGYSGSQEGMEQLIAKANELREANGEMGNLTIDSYADIVQAIHEVQIAQGIEGTTANEAASTISGSIAMTQSAWSNFVTAIARGGEQTEYAAMDLAESFGHAVENIAERVGSIASTITEALPMVLPIFLDALMNLIETISGLIGEYLQPLLSAVVEAVKMIADKLPEILPPLIDAIVVIITAIAEMLPVLMPVILQAAIQLFMALVEALPQILPLLIDAALASIDAVIQMLPTLIPALLQAAITLFMAIVQAIPEIIGSLLGSIGEMLGQVFSKITGGGGDLFRAAGDFFGNLLKGISEAVPNIINFVTSIPGKILEALGNLGSLLLDAGKNIIGGLLEGITGAFGAVADFVGGIAGWIFEHKGPLQYDANLLKPAGDAIMGGFGESLEKSFEGVKDFVGGIGGELQGELNGGLTANIGTRKANGAGGVVIKFEHCDFAVRDDSDIDRLSTALANKVNRAALSRLGATA